jgi:hypothetical protein
LLSRAAELVLDEAASEPGSTLLTTVEYSQLADADLEGKELIRLSPPEPHAPTFVLERKAIEVLTAGEATINQIIGLPQPVLVEGDLFVGADPVQAEFSLHFVSNKLILDGNAYQNPTESMPVYFSKKTQSDASSHYTVELLPGEYAVYALPISAESSMAVTKTSLTVASGEPQQKGKSIVINPTTELQGVALGPSSNPVAGAKVRALASPEPLDPVWVALGLTPPKPLSVDGIVGSDGRFAVEVHPGALDVSIRPDHSTGFAWFVRPNVEVQGGIHNLGDVKLPLPVVYQGAVKVSDTVPLPNALIQAYVFLGAQGYAADRESAKAIVQVAETRADSLGNFQLLVPAHLN